MKVLVSAYACEPDKGSEPGVGWQLAMQISRFADVWVITRSNNRSSIEQEQAKHPNPKLHINYTDLPDWLSFWKRGQKGIYLYYVLWQVIAFFEARRLHQQNHFDIVHHVTFGTVWLPTFMQFLDIPFIWGPIGGAETVPNALRTHLSFKWRLYESIRDLLIKWTYSYDPISRSAMRKASLIIARTKITQDAFPLEFQKKIYLMIETGVSRKFIESMRNVKGPKQSPIVLMMGRLLHWKGFCLGIEAFSKILKRFPDTRLVIVGSGPEEEKLKSLSKQLNINQNIEFTGQLSRDDALRIMSQALIFLNPSMKDAGAWVFFEAMASGLPIVCLDYAGPAVVIDKTCAFAIPIDERDKVIDKLSTALEKLLSSDSLIKAMGKASVKRLENNFLWEYKGDIIKNLYQNIVDRKTES